MTSIFNTKMFPLGVGFLTLALCFSLVSAPALAQPSRRPGPPPRHYGPPPRYHYHSDIGPALAIAGIGIGVAAIANARNNRYYYQQPAVVVAPPPRPVIIERPVVVHQQVPVVIGSNGSYSDKLGVSFRIENIQIPGKRFAAARLTSDPLPDSPLYGAGLRRGDVLTRIDDSPADSLAELERHEGETLIRYIKTGTTKVLLAGIYIPTDDEFYDGGAYNAP
ncbi:MAG: hypothetical protein LBI05_07335 [Planctomycetaceae bacterium]|jgi:hypothetical protein|nr:hypothetical protein [Planctomycetaceae bacterium]